MYMKDKVKSVYGIRIDILALLGGKLLLNGRGDYFLGDRAVAGSRKVNIKGKTLVIELKENQKLKLVVGFHFERTKI